ncbi:MAG: zinc ribbon domain-containing protein [Acidobacteria bacterium]|nr:zinc ribbon domain-containing protein [Acidobacteriota bacterium]
MVVIICALLAVGAIGFTLIVRERDIPPAPVENPELKHLENRRQVLYENLKDLQFEFHQGKLSEADYQSLKGGFLNDLASVMAAIEVETEKSAKKTAGSHRAKRPMDVFSEAQRKAHPEEETAGAAVAEAVASEQPASGDHHGALLCSACGAENAAQNRFCGQCGGALAV